MHIPFISYIFIWNLKERRLLVIEQVKEKEMIMTKGLLKEVGGGLNRVDDL